MNEFERAMYFAEQVPEQAPEEASWNITRGLKSGGLSTLAVAPAVGSMAAKLVGWGEGAEKMAQAAGALMEKASGYQPDTSFKELVQKPTVGKAVDWAMYMLGNIAPSMIAGGVGAGVGKSLFLRTLLKRAIAKNVAKGLTLEAASTQAVNQVAKKGAMTGLVGATGAMEGGHMYLTDVEKHGVEDARVAPHIAGGLAAGLVELSLGGVEIGLINKFFGKAGVKAAEESKDEAVSMLGKIWKYAKTPAGEAGQELVQEEIAMLDEMFVAKPGEKTDTPLSKEGLWRGAESAAAGLLPGAIGGAVTGLVTEKEAQREETPQDVIDSVRNQLEDPASEVDMDFVKAMTEDSELKGHDEIIAGLKGIISEAEQKEVTPQETPTKKEDYEPPGDIQPPVKKKLPPEKRTATGQKEIEETWAKLQTAEGMENLPPETVSLLRKAQELAPKGEKIYRAREQQKAEALRKEGTKRPVSYVEDVDETQVEREALRDTLSQPDVTTEQIPIIPDLKDTTQAKEFGEQATPEQITELKRLRQDSLDKKAQLQKAGKLQEAMNEITKGQLYREAIEEAAGEITPKKEGEGIGKPIGSFKTTQKDAFGDSSEVERSVLSLSEPVNVRGKTSSGNWKVDYETPSSLGKTGKQTQTKYFWKKAEAQEWINEVKPQPITKIEPKITEKEKSLAKSPGEDTKFETKVAEYAGAHTAPSQDEGASLDDFSNVFPDDIYGAQGARYYGHGGKSAFLDKQTIQKIKHFRGNPNASVKVYRAIPKDTPISEINEGDWVTINKQYAVQHGATNLDKYKIVEKTVKARELFTDGNSIHEWGYWPEEKFETKAKQAKPLAPEDIKKAFGKTKAMTGTDDQGRFWFKFKSLPKITVVETDNITGGLTYQKGATITGAYVPGKQMMFKTSGKGIKADIGSVYHENWHLFKDVGVVTSKDKFILHQAIRKDGHKGMITEETEAGFIGDAMINRTQHADTLMGKVLQKVADFFDAIAHLLGHRTMRSLLRDVESGKITEQTGDTKVTGTVKPAYRYETKQNQQAADFVKEELKKPDSKEAFKKLNQTPKNEFKSLMEEKGDLLKDFTKRFGINRVPSKDMKWWHRGLEAPSMLARRYKSMKDALDVGVRAQEARIKLTNTTYHTVPVHSSMSLQDAQETITKDKSADSEMEKLTHKWDGVRFPEKQVPTNWFKHIKTDNSLQIKSEHYREAAKFLKAEGVSQKVIDGFIAMRVAYDKALIETHNKLLIEEWIDRDDIAEFRSQIGKTHNYFPHKRHGDTGISIRNKKTNELIYNAHYLDFKERFLPKRKQAHAKAEKWLKESFKGDIADVVIQKPYKITKLPDQVFHQIDLSAMQQILDATARKVIEAENPAAAEDVKIEARLKLKKVMAESISDTVKSRAWAGHAIGRKDIPGYETGDIWGTTFDYFTGWAGFMTKLDTAKEYSEILQNINAKKNPNEYQYMSTYVRDMLTNKNSVDRAVDFVRGLFFVKYLGFVVKSGLVNLTQNVVLAAPVLSLYTKGSTVKLSKAMIDTRRALFSKGALAGKDVHYGKHVKGLEAKALNQLVEEGTAQDQMLRELKGTIPAHGAMKIVRKLIDKSGIFMQVAEKFNRASTGLAAFRIAYNEGITQDTKNTKGDYDASVKFAKKIIYDAHFLYGDLNLPSGFRGGDFRKIIRSAYTFRTFTHQYLGMINHLFWRQKGGKAAIARSMRNLLLLGGLTAIPFFKSLSELLARFTDDEDEDLLTKIREKMPNQFMKNFAVYGLAGVGGADITGSIGIEFPRSFIDILGVPYSVIESTGNTIESLKSGSYSRALAGAPFTPIVIGNAMRGIELHTIGQRTRSGRDINFPGEPGPKKITKGEAIGKAILGIQPPSMSSGYKAYYASSKMKKTISGKKIRWADRYVNAVRRGDEDERYKIVREIVEWNIAAVEDNKPWRRVNIEQMVINRMAASSLRGVPKIQRQRALEISQAWR
jgi:hypothetical protein